VTTTRRPRAHHSRCPYTDSNRYVFRWRQNVSVKWSVSDLLPVCFILAEQQQRKLCRWFGNMSAEWRGRQTTKRASISTWYVWPGSDLWTSKHNLYWILSANGKQCNSTLRAGVTWSCGLRSRMVCAMACRARWNGASVKIEVRPSRYPANFLHYVWQSHLVDRPCYM